MTKSNEQAAVAAPGAPGQGASPVVLHGMILVVTALALLQAVLGGRGWFVEPVLIGVHGWVGVATMLTSVVLLGLAVVHWRRGGVGRLVPVLSGLILLLLFAQLGLGYSGRRSEVAASLHVPNGALIFGACVALGARVWSRRLDRANAGVVG